MAALVRPVRRRRPVTRSPLVALLRGAAVVLAILTTLGPAAPVAVAASSGAASSATRAGSGAPCVGVVIDGRLAGGTLRTACATGNPRNGLAALSKAGFTYAFVLRSPGLVCQIDGLPSCTDTGTQTYWSYWWRGRGSDRWVYSNEGAGTRDPEPGDTEAWVWQDGGRRTPPSIAFFSICPQAKTTVTRSASASASASASPSPRPASSSRRPSASMTTSTPRSAKPSTSSSASRPGTSTASGTAPAAAALTSITSTTAASPSGPTSTTATDAATSAAAAASSTPVTTPSVTAASTSSDGVSSWVGPLLGAGVVVLLGGAAASRYRRAPGGSP